MDVLVNNSQIPLNLREVYHSSVKDNRPFFSGVYADVIQKLIFPHAISLLPSQSPESSLSLNWLEKFSLFYKRKEIVRKEL